MAVSFYIDLCYIHFMQNNLLKIKQDHIDVVSSKELFQTETDFQLPCFKEPNEFTPIVNEAYQFNASIVNAICLAIAHNKPMYLHGLHGSGKSTHIEQVAARLNWPVTRISFDSHITRMDLIGRDVLKIESGKQMTEFQHGLIPFALQQSMILILDEYDAAKPELLFVLQRLLEQENAFHIIENNEMIQKHLYFRVFATGNTASFGDDTGLYQGTSILNQGHMDRWQIIMKMSHLQEEQEFEIINHQYQLNTKQKNTIKKMVQFAHLTRNAFLNEQLSLFLSIRSLLSWVDTYMHINNIQESLLITIWSRFSKEEQSYLKELYQRCFAKEWVDEDALC